MYDKITKLRIDLEKATERLAELQSAGGMLKEEVSPEDIATVVSKWTGIPVNRVLESTADKFLHMEELIKKRVVGQDDAVSKVSRAVRRSRAGLDDDSKPIGSFIFLGPTGVGKTELARALAEFLFDDERAMVRIDMSEYMEKHSVARLIGAPPGYVGYEEGGALTEAVRRRPYSVILFDEIEKAHHDVFHVLLQVLDDGRLTDGQGRTVNFRNTILIMTSNLGSRHIQEFGSDNPVALATAMKETLQATFRPEFLNRIDEIITFRNLEKEDIRHIVDIQISLLKQRLSGKNIQIEITDAALDWLGDAGYDPVYGARPLKRMIQFEIMDPMAVLVLEGKLSENSTAYVDAGQDGSLDIQVKTADLQKE